MGDILQRDRTHIPFCVSGSGGDSRYEEASGKDVGSQQIDDGGDGEDMDGEGNDTEHPPTQGKSCC